MSLSDELPSGTQTVWTIGQASLPVDGYISLLKSVGVTLVVDVRSRPYSSHQPQFDTDALRVALTAAGVTYDWRGELLGQRPVGDEFYDDDGHTLYERIAEQKWFMREIGRLEYEAETQRVALTCLEEQPERCHRYALLGRVLLQRGHEVLHVRKDGRVHSQHDIAVMLGEGQGALFGEQSEPVWRSAEPMRRGHNTPEDDEWSW